LEQEPCSGEWGFCFFAVRLAGLTPGANIFRRFAAGFGVMRAVGRDAGWRDFGGEERLRSDCSRHLQQTSGSSVEQVAGGRRRGRPR